MDHIMIEIVQPLLDWYRKNARRLPWREHPSAYTVWVSEVMLQQTRVEAVKPYYYRFIHRLPDTAALADCPEEELLRLWEGLGYYSRVRNMQEAARQVMQDYYGVFPSSYEELLSLKGIGEYTAGAVASIAFGEPVPAVDGNVLRVMARLKEDPGDTGRQAVKRRIRQELVRIIPHDAPGEFNQAMMELGAVVCLPVGSPKCGDCPLRASCRAFQNHTQEDYPVRSAKKPRRTEERTILLIRDKDHILLAKRPPGGLLAGLYEPVNLPGVLDARDAGDYVKRLGLSPESIRCLPPARHIFTHIEWRMEGFLVGTSSLTGIDTEKTGLLPAGIDQLHTRYALPSAYRPYMEILSRKLTGGD